MQAIRIRGARTHNLKNISVDIPRHQLIVITGLSGSGKSSLAFDTLYAEGQRRYVESLSAYARQFLQIMDKPDVDLIEGLSPAIAIEQKTAGHNPRSTVGTITEIHDYLRLLYARVGTPYCPTHHLPLQAHNVSQMVDALYEWPTDSRIAILAPLTYEAEQGYDDLRIGLQAQGFIRVRINDQMHLLQEPWDEDSAPIESLQIVVDRLRLRSEHRQRLSESIETALEAGNGRVLLLNLDAQTPVEQTPNAPEPKSGASADGAAAQQPTSLAFSDHFACPLCDVQLSALEPRLFSFNNPTGACPDCNGLGKVDQFDAQRIVAFPHLGLANGAIYGWDRRNAFTANLLQSLAQHYDFDLNTPYTELPASLQQIILYGSGDEKIDFIYLNEQGEHFTRAHVFEGVIPNLERRWRETQSSAVKEELGKLRHTVSCPACQGARLNAQARHVRIGDEPGPGEEKGLAIYELEALPLTECENWFSSLKLQGAKKEIAHGLVQGICARLSFLNNVGLGYLSLDRAANTLSGGESQRIRLASQIGSGLAGVMYVLDEPSIGLHQRDNDRLIDTLRQLRDLGNSIIVVEHDEDMIRQADHIIDMGPGAGEHGGRIVAQGSPKQIMACAESLTGQYLVGKQHIAQPTRRAVDDDPQAPSPRLCLYGARGHNLKNVDLQLPLGRLICVTGVSGSGKSTLINDTLGAALARDLNRAHTQPEPFDRIEGLEQLDKLILVDQSPIGRTPRSNPATYTGLFTPIRELFAGVPEARLRGYDPGRFSFNVKGGRCETCQGDGVIKVEMHFLADVYVPCDSCKGQRYNQETLQILYRGKNISEVLNMTVGEALEYFSAIPAIERRLQTLKEVGLSYIRLGQNATTLSGGEAQRIKLALELSRRSTGSSLYLLDEPTTGLHFHDVKMLLQVLQQLVEAGNTVVIIEHNLEVIKCADWVIDLGPEGGQAGGQIIAQGTPETIAQTPHSHTGRYLKPLLKQEAATADAADTDASGAAASDANATDASDAGTDADAHGVDADSAGASGADATDASATT